MIGAVLNAIKVVQRQISRTGTLKFLIIYDFTALLHGTGSRSESLN